VCECVSECVCVSVCECECVRSERALFRFPKVEAFNLSLPLVVRRENAALKKKRYYKMWF